MKPQDIQRAFEKFMTTGQDQESVTTALQHHLGDETLDFCFVPPDPSSISRVLVDNGDGTLTALVTIQINITKLQQDEDDE
jgi:hypothetical protein